MAKTPNGLGQYSGKVGGVVYAVQNGQQIVRAYQPVVSNPKSLSQRLQRAKANLVGQISKITPYQILMGLGDNRRARRSRFLRLSMNATTANASESDSTIIRAKLDAPNFVFAEGSFVPTITISEMSVTARSVSLTLSRLLGVSDADFNASGCLVVVNILQSSGLYEAVLYRYVSSDEFASGTLSVELPHISEGAYEAYAYLAPFATIDGVSLRARADEMFGENASFTATMNYNPSAVPLVWGRSEYLRTASFKPAGA